MSTEDVTGVKLIVGLGNPGERYRNTRHNAGALVVERLAARRGLTFRKTRGGAACRLGGVLLFRPDSFMNLSGQSVQAALVQAKAQPAQLLLVHDDLDLPLGRLRFRKGGGAGGQKGVRDTISRIGQDFWRLKVGISRPPPGWAVEDWVLSRFRPDERDLLERVLDTAVEAVETALESGVEQAMNRYNGTDLLGESD